MPQYESDRIRKLVSQMREAVSQLKRLKKYEKNVFLNDPDKIGSAKYNFIVAIEAAIDMCNHIISRNGYRSPEDYSDTFAVLGEQGAFDCSFTNELKDMAKFRNRLVHIYWEIDDDKIYEILLTRLDDFKYFLDKLAEFLNLAELS